jgi:hypothetical protein
LLPLQALGDNLVIRTEPARVEIPDVKFYRLSYGFQEDAPGRFQLQVDIRYRPWISDVERVAHFTFRLQSGSVVQRDDQTLMLRLDDREMIVGQHHWWYAPYWQAAADVQIACDSRRQSRRLIIENCRLIVEKLPFGERNGLAYPSVAETSITRDVRAVTTRARYASPA